MAVRITSCSCLYIVIDALDECEEKSRSLLLSRFANMIRSRTPDGEIWRKGIKLILSGQLLISRAWRVGDGTPSQFYIDMEGRRQGLVEDLQLFVDYKVEDLVTMTFALEKSATS